MKKKRLKMFRLTINWKHTPTITVEKELPNMDLAKQWSRLALEMCGKNEEGDRYSSYSLDEVPESVYVPDPEKDYINGNPCKIGWAQKHAFNQILTHARINDKVYPRVVFGKEMRFGNISCKSSVNKTCGDCSTAIGEVHVYGCDIEECPRCGGQFAYCKCCVELGILLKNGRFMSMHELVFN